MRTELEQKLAAEFPFMLPKRDSNQNGYIDDLYTEFGCECGDGWYEVIRGLCRDIVNAYEEVGIAIEFQVEQIKEKYGSLRFYFGNYPHELSDKLFEIVGKWEHKSEETCEVCGEQGKLRTNRPWIRTLCDKCNQV
jgi:hypothetical protein